MIILSMINHSYNRTADSPLHYLFSSFPSPPWPFTLCPHRVSLHHTSKEQENNFQLPFLSSSRAYIPLCPSAHTRHEEPSLVLLHVEATCQQILIIITCKVHVL